MEGVVRARLTKIVYPRVRQYRYYWCAGGSLCGVFGVQAEESGRWDYGGCEEVLGWVGCAHGEGRGGWKVSRNGLADWMIGCLVSMWCASAAREVQWMDRVG